ncbi:hypothetical protein EDC04DRAFT_2953509, partial [Pisolithus marmoratus]
RYHNEYQTEDLDNAVQHFECAWRCCPLTHRYHAAVLVNLAKAKFTSCQADPASADLEEPILLYRKALDLRRPGHPDRPATLLQLAQTLLFRYEKQGYDESVGEEITELMTESKDFSEDSHERRAADLVLETLKRCSVVNSGSLGELDEVVRKLKYSARVAPDSYFDRPQRLINLSTTLWRRYQKHGELSYLTELIALSEEALLLIPKGHPERSYWVTMSAILPAELSQCLGDIALEAQEYEEAIARYIQASVVLQSAPS